MYKCVELHQKFIVYPKSMNEWEMSMIKRKFYIVHHSWIALWDIIWWVKCLNAAIKQFLVNSFVLVLLHTAIIVYYCFAFKTPNILLACLKNKFGLCIILHIIFCFRNKSLCATCSTFQHWNFLNFPAVYSANVACVCSTGVCKVM